MTTLAHRLKLARAHAKITQRKLAELAGVEQPAISQMESGKTLKSAHLVALAKACGVNADWLATGTGQMSSEPSNVEILEQPSR
ncbi:helix-turn-helix domain-containing protein, partial [Pseudomonas viridiflava]